MLDYIFVLFYYVPIFSLKVKSKKNNCFIHFARNNIEDDQKIYISLVNILFGSHNLLLFSFTFKIEKLCNNYFKWNELKFKPLDLNIISQNVDFNLEEGHWTNIEKMYRNHLDTLDSADIELEKESLKRRLDIEENRVSVARSKMNLFVAFCAFTYPYIFHDYLCFSRLTAVGWIKGCVLVYFTLNLFVLFHEVIRNRIYPCYTFSDVKNSLNKIRELNIQYYFDFQCVHRKANMFVNFADMILHWIVITILFSIFSYNLYFLTIFYLFPLFILIVCFQMPKLILFTGILLFLLICFPSEIALWISIFIEFLMVLLLKNKNVICKIIVKYLAD